MDIPYESEFEKIGSLANRQGELLARDIKKLMKNPEKSQMTSLSINLFKVSNLCDLQIQELITTEREKSICDILLTIQTQFKDVVSFLTHAIVSEQPNITKTKAQISKKLSYNVLNIEKSNFQSSIESQNRSSKNLEKLSSILAPELHSKRESISIPQTNVQNNAKDASNEIWKGFFKNFVDKRNTISRSAQDSMVLTREPDCFCSDLVKQVNNLVFDGKGQKYSFEVPVNEPKGKESAVEENEKAIERKVREHMLDIQSNLSNPDFTKIAKIKNPLVLIRLCERIVDDINLSNREDLETFENQLWSLDEILKNTLQFSRTKDTLKNVVSERDCFNLHAPKQMINDSVLCPLDMPSLDKIFQNGSRKVLIDLCHQAIQKYETLRNQSGCEMQTMTDISAQDIDNKIGWLTENLKQSEQKLYESNNLMESKAHEQEYFEYLNETLKNENKNINAANFRLNEHISLMALDLEQKQKLIDTISEESIANINVKTMLEKHLLISSKSLYQMQNLLFVLMQNKDDANFPGKNFSLEKILPNRKSSILENFKELFEGHVSQLNSIFDETMPKLARQVFSQEGMRANDSHSNEEIWEDILPDENLDRILILAKQKSQKLNASKKMVFGFNYKIFKPAKNLKKIVDSLKTMLRDGARYISLNNKSLKEVPRHDDPKLLKTISLGKQYAKNLTRSLSLPAKPNVDEKVCLNRWQKIKNRYSQCKQTREDFQVSTCDYGNLMLIRTGINMHQNNTDPKTALIPKPVVSQKPPLDTKIFNNTGASELFREEKIQKRPLIKLSTPKHNEMLDIKSTEMKLENPVLDNLSLHDLSGESPAERAIERKIINSQIVSVASKNLSSTKKKAHNEKTTQEDKDEPISEQLESKSRESKHLFSVSEPQILIFKKHFGVLSTVKVHKNTASDIEIQRFGFYFVVHSDSNRARPLVKFSNSEQLILPNHFYMNRIEQNFRQEDRVLMRNKDRLLSSCINQLEEPSLKLNRRKSTKPYYDFLGNQVGNERLSAKRSSQAYSKHLLNINQNEFHDILQRQKNFVPNPEELNFIVQKKLISEKANDQIEPNSEVPTAVKLICEGNKHNTSRVNHRRKGFFLPRLDSLDKCFSIEKPKPSYLENINATPKMENLPKIKHVFANQFQKDSAKKKLQQKENLDSLALDIKPLNNKITAHVDLETNKHEYSNHKGAFKDASQSHLQKSSAKKFGHDKDQFNDFNKKRFTIKKKHDGNVSKWHSVKVHESELHESVVNSEHKQDEIIQNAISQRVDKAKAKVHRLFKSKTGIPESLSKDKIKSALSQFYGQHIACGDNCTHENEFITRLVEEQSSFVKQIRLF